MDQGAGAKLKKMIVELRAKVIDMALRFDEIEPTPEARQVWRNKYDELASDMQRLLVAYAARRGLGPPAENPDQQIDQSD
jgi:hypothetical protein